VSPTKTRKKISELGAVAAGLAHEIRNPLNSLFINSQLLEEMIAELPGEPVPQKEEMLSLARANMKVARRLNETLSGFLRFARPSAMELGLVDLNRVVSETLRFLDVDFARRGIVPEVRFHPSALPLLADERQLKQALLNLLLNAEEALDKEEKSIRVATGVRRGRPYVRIQDNGRGIPAAERRQIFRVFFTTRREGSGLGLPIVRQIVRQHGGSISVRSREGVGTTITVSIPFESQFRAMFPGRQRLALPAGPQGQGTGIPGAAR
jgi:two-component system sensor histidine kinase PilS (NtrC family)